MKYRKLRIEWSVAWGQLAVLLCGLWVTSMRMPRYFLRRGRRCFWDAFPLADSSESLA